MEWYLKTKMPLSIVSAYLRRYIDLSRDTFVLPKKLKDEISQEYKLNEASIVRLIINNVAVSTTTDNLIQVRIIDQNLQEGKSLKQLLGLIEFGNLENEPTKSVSRLLNRALSFTRDAMGAD